MKSMAELVAHLRDLGAKVADLARVVRELMATVDHNSVSLADGLDDLRRVVETLREALPPNLVTVTRFAEVWGVSTSTVWRWVNDGELPTVRVGRTVRIDMGKVHGAPADGRPQPRP